MMHTEEKRPTPVEDVKEEESDDEEATDEGEKSSDFDDEEDEKEEQSPPFPVDELIPSPTRDEKKQPDVLNLNNEVVKMRKEVKRIKALIIRKQTRQIAALKKKKGKEADVERNQRRAERLLEEVHCMKKLLPDLVTKTALQKNLNFEHVCKNPKATISDRAVARIATHPQFNKKIESIKAAVKSFKEEHMKGGKLRGNAKGQKPLGNAAVPSPDTAGGEKNQEKQKDKAVKLQKDSEEGVSFLQIQEDRSLAKTMEEMEETPDAVDHEEEAAETASVRSPSVKIPSKKEKSQSEAEEISSDLRSSALLHKQADEEESDIESSDNEEREYFDDSTEERFRRQSSQSEESDDDDFFLGKVSKFKRKQHQTDTGGEKKKVDKGQEEKKGSTDIVRTPDKLQSELDELESRLKSKATALQTIFCSSLAGNKTGRGSERGRGGGKFKGQHSRGANRDYFSKQLKSQQQEKGHSVSRSNSKLCPEKDGRGRGRGRGVQGQKDHRGGHVSAHQPPLHPSWEASKKRKEQQGQIVAFQGKKIKFDDD